MHMRSGRWVLHGERIAVLHMLGAIVAGRNEDGAAVAVPLSVTSRVNPAKHLSVPPGSGWIHYVDPVTGETVDEAVVPYEALRAPTLDQLPEARRAHITPEQWAEVNRRD